MDIKKVLTETLAVLSVLGGDYVNRLPKSLMDLIIENADYENIPVIDPNIRIEDNDAISMDTKIFLGSLKLKYWSGDDKERQEILDSEKENKKKSQTDETS